MLGSVFFIIYINDMPMQQKLSNILTEYIKLTVLCHWHSTSQSVQ